MFICKYCGKECKNKNSLVQHEIRCKHNKNRIKIVHPIGNGGKTKGYITTCNGDIEKHVKQSDIERYINEGWKIGRNDVTNKKLNTTMLNKYKNGYIHEYKDPKLRQQKISASMKGNTNWKFNKKHGNGKKGWYKGIFCDSSWELAFLVYHIEHNLKIERCKIKLSYEYDGSLHTYIPDFVTSEGIIEVKGRFNDKAIEKQKQHPEIIVYEKNKMKNILEYIISKYGDEFWKKLYE